jgi:hypothetical protein
VCRLTVARRVSLVGQELLALPKHLSSSQVLGGVRVLQSLAFGVNLSPIIVVFVSASLWPLYCLSIWLPPCSSVSCNRENCHAWQKM